MPGPRVFGAFVLALMLAIPTLLQPTLAAGGSGNAPLPYASAQQDERADVTFSFFTCPDDFDPTLQADPAGTCTTPATMSPDATLGAAPDFVVEIGDFTEIDTGVYSLSMSAGWPLHFGDFVPEGSNASLIEGDGVAGGLITPQTDGGAVNVYGYIQPEDVGTVAFTFLACPDGFNPEDEQELEPFISSCNQPIDAPEGANVGDGIGSYPLNQVPRGVDGTYYVHDIAQPVSLTIRDFEAQGTDISLSYPAESWVRDMWTLDTTVTTSYINVFVWDDVSESTPQDPVGRGTVQLTLLGCPEGVDPTGVAAGTPGTEYCDNVIRPTGDAALAWDGGEIRLDSLEPEPDGQFRITGLPLNTVITLVDLQPSSRDSLLAEGLEVNENGDPYFTLTANYPFPVSLYYYDAIDQSTPDEPVGGGTVYLSLRGCPEGVDPTGVASDHPGTDFCDNVIQATGDAALVWDGGSVRLDSLTPDTDGNYTITGLPLNETITFVDLQPSNMDSWMAVGTTDWTTDGNPFMALSGTDTAYVSFYYYNEL